MHPRDEAEGISLANPRNPFFISRSFFLEPQANPSSYFLKVDAGNLKGVIANSRTNLGRDRRMYDSRLRRADGLLDYELDIKFIKLLTPQISIVNGPNVTNRFSNANVRENILDWAVASSNGYSTYEIKIDVAKNMAPGHQVILYESTSGRENSFRAIFRSTTTSKNQTVTLRRPKSRNYFYKAYYKTPRQNNSRSRFGRPSNQLGITTRDIPTSPVARLRPIIRSNTLTGKYRLQITSRLQTTGRRGFVVDICEADSHLTLSLSCARGRLGRTQRTLDFGPLPKGRYTIKVSSFYGQASSRPTVFSIDSEWAGKYTTTNSLRHQGVNITREQFNDWTLPSAGSWNSRYYNLIFNRLYNAMRNHNNFEYTAIYDGNRPENVNNANGEFSREEMARVSRNTSSGNVRRRSIRLPNHGPYRISIKPRYRNYDGEWSEYKNHDIKPIGRNRRAAPARNLPDICNAPGAEFRIECRNR